MLYLREPPFGCPEPLWMLLKCTYLISHSIPLLELCSRNKCDIDMRASRAGLNSEAPGHNVDVVWLRTF